MKALFVSLGTWERKGLLILLEAQRRLHKEHEPVELVLLGKPGLGEAALLEPYRDLLAAGCLHTLGHRDDVRSVYQSCDVLLCASYYETCSLAMLEALAAGLPIITTPVHSAQEMVEDGVNGWIVNYEAADFVRAQKTLADDDALRKRMGEASRQRAARFNADHMAALTAEAYRASLASRA